MGKLVSRNWADRIWNSVTVQSGREFMARDLADEFGVSQRKLVHSLRHLRELGLIVSHRPVGNDGLVHKLKPQTKNWLCLPWRKHSNAELECVSDRIGMACMEIPPHSQMDTYELAPGGNCK